MCSALLMMALGTVLALVAEGMSAAVAVRPAAGVVPVAVPAVLLRGVAVAVVLQMWPQLHASSVSWFALMAYVTSLCRFLQSRHRRCAHTVTFVRSADFRSLQCAMRKPTVNTISVHTVSITFRGIFIQTWRSCGASNVPMGRAHWQEPGSGAKHQLGVSAAVVLVGQTA